MTKKNAIALTDGTAQLLPVGDADPLAQLARYADRLGDALRFAEVVCRTPLVGPTFQGKPEAGAVAILYGAELGLNPLQSLQQVFVVHGQPTIYARTMRALLLSKGFRFRTVESSDTSVTVEGTAPNGDIETVTWTIDRARRAGYTSNKKYETDPQGMLFAKASAEVCRKLAPDVLLGISRTLEEAETEPPMVRVQSERLTAAEVLAGATPADEPVDSDAEAAGRPVADSPAPAEDVAPSISRARAVHLGKLLDAEGVKTRGDKLAYLSDQFKRNFTAVTELTEFEGEQIIAFLEGGQDAGTDETAGGGQ